MDEEVQYLNMERISPNSNSISIVTNLWEAYYLLCFLFNKIRKQEGRTGSAQKWGRGGSVVEERASGSNNVYTCK
jgi:hypothetical protein